MPNAFEDLSTVNRGAYQYDQASEAAWTLEQCSDCGGSQCVVVAVDTGRDVEWLRCVNCQHGMVRNQGVVSPGPKPLRMPMGVPGAEAAVWEEARNCLSVGASNAAVLMCRKLLLHVAVTHGLPAKDARNRAPTFTQAVAHLESEGLITKVMRPWVDRIKEVGNGATHEIEAITTETAMDVASFTEQLLRLSYEMKALMGEVEPENETED